MNKKSKIELIDIVTVGMMAAVVFAVTLFLSIKVPTPTGQTMLKVANAFILMAGILFGGVRGGLAAGIGSMLFDFTDPMYVSEAWITLIRFFLMAYICGKIAWIGGAEGKNQKLNIAAALISSVFSTIFYIGKGVITMMLAGSEFMPALIGQAPKMGSSIFNLVMGVVLTALLTPALRAALVRAGIYKKLNHSSI